MMSLGHNELLTWQPIYHKDQQHIIQSESSCVGVPQGQDSSYYTSGGHLHIGSVLQWFTSDLIGLYGFFVVGLLWGT